eukprot:2475046-Pleurochrysis_carterae.AAC.1
MRRKGRTATKMRKRGERQQNEKERENGKKNEKESGACVCVKMESTRKCKQKGSDEGSAKTRPMLSVYVLEHWNAWCVASGWQS